MADSHRHDCDASGTAAASEILRRQSSGLDPQGIGAGKKSLTLTLNFRDPARTLKSEEVDTQVKTAVDLLAAKFAAVLRA